MMIVIIFAALTKACLSLLAGHSSGNLSYPTDVVDTLDQDTISDSQMTSGQVSPDTRNLHDQARYPNPCLETTPLGCIYLYYNKKNQKT